MMWLSSYSKLLLDQTLFVTQESQYRFVPEIAAWELRPESRQLKCGASTDHIAFLSGRCRGYDLHNKSSFSLWDAGGSHLLDRLWGKLNFKKGECQGLSSGGLAWTAHAGPRRQGMCITKEGKEQPSRASKN